MENWQYKIWSNDTTLNYLNTITQTKMDLWSLPLDSYIYHCVAEAALLYSVITGKTSKCCEPLLYVEEMNEIYNKAVSCIKEQYADQFKGFTKFRLQSKLNDLLLMVNEFPKYIGEDFDVWERAVEVLVQEVDESGILDEKLLNNNQTSIS